MHGERAGVDVPVGNAWRANGSLATRQARPVGESRGCRRVSRLMAPGARTQTRVRGNASKGGIAAGVEARYRTVSVVPEVSRAVVAFQVWAPVSALAKRTAKRASPAVVDQISGAPICTS